MLILSLVTLGLGCSGATDWAEIAQEAVQSASVNSRPLDDLADEREPSGDTLKAQLIVDFEPPFPERDNPFRFTDEQEERQVVTSDTVANVEVIGFADVEKKRVMLRIGEQTYWPSEGSEIAGIRVISIRPPHVELRRGSLTWTVGMFDEHGVTGRTR
ncbi:MAG: hypothetical protein AAF958_03185 [Planctomycetota bacterium]